MKTIASILLLFTSTTSIQSFRYVPSTPTEPLKKLSAPHLNVVSSSHLNSQRDPTFLLATRLDECSTDVFHFDEMKKLDQRLDTLEELSGEFLMDFYEPDLCSFSIQPGKASRISITSTCYSILAIYNSADPSLFRIKLNRILKELLLSPWKEDDIYQVSLLLLTVLKSDPCILKRFDNELNEKIAQLISLCLTARPKRQYGENQIFSEYIAFLCCSMYTKLN